VSNSGKAWRGRGGTQTPQCEKLTERHENADCRRAFYPFGRVPRCLFTMAAQQEGPMDAMQAALAVIDDSAVEVIEPPKKSKGRSATPLPVETEAVLLDLLEKFRGRRARTAKAMGLSQSTIDAYIKRSPKAQVMCAEMKELEKDAVEEALLHAALKKGRVDAQIFYLKTQARDRNYGETVDINQKVTKTVNVTLDWSKMDRDALKKAEAAFKQIGVYDATRTED
jgi:hypothetical protein